MSKQSKGQKFTKHQQTDQKRDGMVPEASSKSQASTASSTSQASYSSVVSGASHTATLQCTSGSGRGVDSDIAELKKMMQALD
jgi:hypothetical protein